MVRASVSQSVDLGFNPLVESYQMTLKNGIHSFSARHLTEVVENKPASSLVVSLGKALNGTPRLYVEDRWLRHLGNDNSQASEDVPSKIYQYNSLSLEWRINMANKNKKNFQKSETICWIQCRLLCKNSSQQKGKVGPSTTMRSYKKMKKYAPLLNGL